MLNVIQTSTPNMSFARSEHPVHRRLFYFSNITGFAEDQSNDSLCVSIYLTVPFGGPGSCLGFILILRHSQHLNQTAHIFQELKSTPQVTCFEGWNRRQAILKIFHMFGPKTKSETCREMMIITRFSHGLA